MRTRSDAARQRSLLKLPEDCLRNVALFIDCDVDAARLALTSRRVMRSMTPTVWAQILKASHGGLKIAAAETDGLRCAARLAAARADEGPVDGFFALATNCGAAPYGQQQYWADALFRREPWRIYCSRSNPDDEPVLCAAAFLAAGDDEEGPDRRYMLDRLEEEDRAWLQETYRDGTASLASVFFAQGEYLAESGDYESREYNRERTLRICRELELRFEDFGQDDEEDTVLNRRGLSSTVYEARDDDGIEVDPRVETLAARAHPATAIATGITIRRAQNFTCPARCGIVYGFRRPPRVSDISDGRLKDLSAAAAPAIHALMHDEPSWSDDEASSDQIRLALSDLESCFGSAPTGWLDSSLHPTEGVCYQLVGGDRDAEVFPLAVFCYGHRGSWDLRNMPDLRATLAVPVAIQGLAVAVVETDDHSHGEANVDLEYVGIEGYAYVPPGHGS